MRLTGTSLFIFGQFIQSVPFHLYSEKLRPSSCSELTELGTKHLLMQAGKLPQSRIRARRMLRGLGLGQNNPRALRAGAANTCLGTGAPTTGPPAQTLWATQPHTQIGCSLASSPTMQIWLGKVKPRWSCWEHFRSIPRDLSVQRQRNVSWTILQSEVTRLARLMCFPGPPTRWEAQHTSSGTD